jgi:hypothetical protein
VTAPDVPSLPGPPADAATVGDSRAPEAITEDLEAAVGSLDGLDERPVGEHVAYFDALHAALQDALASIDGV